MIDKEKLLKRIIEFRERRNWKQFHLPKNLAISLVLESTEVLELFQWSKDHDLPKDSKIKLAEELADVYYWLLLISHDMEINLDDALDKKMDLNEKKYPENLVRGSSKKYNEY